VSEEPPPRRWPRRLVVAAVILVVLFYGGGGWYFSDLIHERGLSGEARRRALDFEPTTEIVALDGDPAAAATVTLAVTDDAGSVDVDGFWGLRWADGYAQLGGITERGDGTVTRAMILVEGQPPDVGDGAELDFRAWPSPPATQAPLEEIAIPGPLGDYPAWFVPGAEGAPMWAIVVHGNAMTRLDGARLLPPLEAAGIPSLTITYRNDPGAPEDPSGLLRYGLTEWEDLEAAVAYAADRGAERVMLIGLSMGGGIVMAFLQRSELAGLAGPVVLDAPMLDFSETVDDSAARETLPLIGLPMPSSLTAVAKRIADARFDVRWEELDYLEDRRAYDGTPFLVYHGVKDATVPIATSRRFARLEPDAVTLVQCPEADHLECWNVDTDRYVREFQVFLDQTTSAP